MKTLVRAAVAGVLVLVLGCSDDGGGNAPAADSGPPAADGAAAGDSGADAGAAADAVAPDLVSQGLGCKAGSCPPCADGKTGCAAKGPFIKGTCCARGDNLVQVGTAKGFETVGLATDGKYLVACTGFGTDISDLSNPKAAKAVFFYNYRCQNSVFGPKLGSGEQIIYTAAHGDGEVENARLTTFSVDGVNKPIFTGTIHEQNIPYGGLAYHKSTLYVAAYDFGLRVYPIAPNGSISKSVGALTKGITNAWKVKLNAAGTHAYVIDAAKGLHVVSLANPVSPTLVTTVATAGAPRDLAVTKDRVYVAMGGLGVQMFDVSTPAKPKSLKTVASTGSAFGVAMVGDVLAVAAWNHLEVRDPKTLALLGTERMAKAFEEDVAVAALDKETILVGEWERVYIVKYAQGLVAPDVYLPQSALAIPPGSASKWALLAQNLGPVDLVLNNFIISDKSFSVPLGPVVIKPGAEEVLEVAFTPPTKADEGVLYIDTNDPDKWQSKITMTFNLQNPSKAGLGVGDKLDKKYFGILDPQGGGNLDNLKGKVVLLAYFALY